MMKLLLLAIALGLTSADGTVRIRKQLPSHERLQIDTDFFDAADIAPLFDDLENFGQRYLMTSMSMSTTTSTATVTVDPSSTSTSASLGLSGISVADLETDKEEVSSPIRTPEDSTPEVSTPEVDATPPFLPPVNPTTVKDTTKDEVVVVDIGSDSESSNPDTQNSGGLSTTATTTSKVAPGSAASSSVNVGGVVGSTIACIAALAGAALLIYKRRQDERLDLPMTN